MRKDCVFLFELYGCMDVILYVKRIVFLLVLKFIEDEFDGGEGDGGGDEAACGRFACYCTCS